jgi:predicted  nucleic acid-binding Zn-ribbon protein
VDSAKLKQKLFKLQRRLDQKKQEYEQLLAAKSQAQEDIERLRTTSERKKRQQEGLRSAIEILRQRYETEQESLQDLNRRIDQQQNENEAQEVEVETHKLRIQRYEGVVMEQEALNQEIQRLIDGCSKIEKILDQFDQKDYEDFLSRERIKFPGQEGSFEEKLGWVEKFTKFLRQYDG